VIGVPDERYGEEIMAWVKLADSVDPASIGADDIRDFCRGRIAHFKIPRYVTFVSDFPMTVTGKVRKIEMREQAIADLGLQAAAAVRNA
jgi:fatty-acyl-CoA synthase